MITTKQKIKLLKAQAGGYLVLARSYAEEGLNKTAKHYLNEAYKMIDMAQSYVDIDKTVTLKGVI